MSDTASGIKVHFNVTWKCDNCGTQQVLSYDIQNVFHHDYASRLVREYERARDNPPGSWGKPYADAQGSTLVCGDCMAAFRAARDKAMKDRREAVKNG